MPQQINQFNKLKSAKNNSMLGIAEGSQGSINGYYRGKLIVSRPLDGKNRTVKNYKNEANLMLIQAMRDGNQLATVKRLSIETLKHFRYKDLIKEPDKQDKDYLMIVILLLIKLKVIEEDGVKEGLLVMGKKKPRRSNETH